MLIPEPFFIQISKLFEEIQATKRQSDLVMACNAILWQRNAESTEIPWTDLFENLQEMLKIAKIPLHF